MVMHMLRVKNVEELKSNDCSHVQDPDGEGTSYHNAQRHAHGHFPSSSELDYYKDIALDRSRPVILTPHDQIRPQRQEADDEHSSPCQYQHYQYEHRPPLPHHHHHNHHHPHHHHHHQHHHPTATTPPPAPPPPPYDLSQRCLSQSQSPSQAPLPPVPSLHAATASVPRAPSPGRRSLSPSLPSRVPSSPNGGEGPSVQLSGRRTSSLLSSREDLSPKSPSVQSESPSEAFNANEPSVPSHHLQADEKVANLTDEKLVSLDLQSLNTFLRRLNVPKEEQRRLKKRRRLLKNRCYATVFRVKRRHHQDTMENDLKSYSSAKRKALETLEDMEKRFQALNEEEQKLDQKIIQIVRENPHLKDDANMFLVQCYAVCNKDVDHEMSKQYLFRSLESMK